MTNPSESASQKESSYNENETKRLDARLAVLERYLEVNTLDAGTRVLGRLKKLENGFRAGTGGPDSQGFDTETVSAAGAVSILKFQTILDGTTSAFAATLAAPAADGQMKIVKLGVSASNHPTISGTNIVTSAGVSKSGTVGTFTSITAGSVSFLILQSIAGVWVILATNVTFA